VTLLYPVILGWVLCASCLVALVWMAIAMDMAIVTLACKPASVIRSGWAMIAVFQFVLAIHLAVALPMVFAMVLLNCVSVIHIGQVRPANFLVLMVHL